MSGIYAATRAAAAANIDTLIIRREEFSITLTGTSNTTAIAGLRKNRSSLFVTGNTKVTTADDQDEANIRVEITDDNTITATRDDQTDTVIVKGYVVEWNDTYVKEVFHGTVTNTTSASQVSGTFNAVLANCAPVYCGNSTTEAADNYASSLTSIVLSGSNGAVSVTATHGDALDTLITSFQIIEFEAGIVNQIQEVDVVMTTETTNTDSISTVDLTKSLTIWCGTQTTNTDGATVNSSFCIGELTNSTTFTATRLASTGDTSTKAVVIEFNDAVFDSVERITSTFGAGETTDNVTLGTTLTNLSRAFVSKLGWNCDTSLDWQGNIMASTTLLTSITNVANVRNTAGAIVLQNSYEVYQT